jgi:transcriptional regulator with XRE-family HTH domain
MITFRDIWQKLSHRKYREQYALSLLKRSVAFQIKTLRKKHCGSQAILAERSRLTQGVVSRAEDQEYGNLTFNTVGRIAAGLDMAFIGKFVPWSELAKFSRDLSEDQFANIPTFEEEDASLQTHSTSNSSFQEGNVATSQAEPESNSGATERKPMGTAQGQARMAAAGKGGR